MKVVLTTLNAKYIHKNLALRWLYVSRIPEADVELMEFVIKDDLERISDQIAQRQPEVIGISVYIWNADLTRKWIAILKRKLPQIFNSFLSESNQNRKKFAFFCEELIITLSFFGVLH